MRLFHPITYPLLAPLTPAGIGIIRGFIRLRRLLSRGQLNRCLCDCGQLPVLIDGALRHRYARHAVFFDPPNHLTVDIKGIPDRIVTAYFHPVMPEKPRVTHLVRELVSHPRAAFWSVVIGGGGFRPPSLIRPPSEFAPERRGFRLPGAVEAASRRAYSLGYKDHPTPARRQ